MVTLKKHQSPQILYFFFMYTNFQMVEDGTGYFDCYMGIGLHKYNLKTR